MNKTEFKIIKGYTRYKINSTGLVIDTQNNDELVELMYDRNNEPLYRIQRDDNKLFKLVRVKHLMWLAFNLEYTESLTDERWKLIKVKGNKEYYVSSKGRIKRLGSVYKEEMIISSKQNTPYKTIKISNKSYAIHRLVASHFIGEISKGYVVHHIDNNKHNNDVSNLAVVTQSENIQAAVKDGRFEFTKNNGRGRSKLTDADARQIRVEYNEGNTSTYKLAEKYGVGHSTIYSVLKRKTFKNA